MRSPLSWHSEASSYSVEQRLMERLTTLRRRRLMAEARLKRSADVLQTMTTAVIEQEIADRLAASWTGSPVVLAFLFSQPGSAAVEQLCQRGAYFNERTGDDWDLFFPGYFTFDTPELAQNTDQLLKDAIHVGDVDDLPWFFNPSYFEKFRKELEHGAKGRWTYSGETDLVVLSVYLHDQGAPTVDWESLQAGQLTDPNVGAHSLTLAEAIEKRMEDHDHDLQDEHFGLVDVFGQPRTDDEGGSGLLAYAPTVIQILRVLAELFHDHW